MSRTRQQSHRWLADHVIFFSYRWLSWMIAFGVVLWREEVLRYGALLLITALVNILSTLLAQSYVRAARRNPVLMSVDILYTVPVLLSAEGWNWPFFPYALSSLVVPSLLFDWRGGLMSGLSFVSLCLGVSYFLGQTPAEMIGDQGWSGRSGLLAVMIVPPLFGIMLPWMLNGLARMLERRSARRPARPIALATTRLEPPDAPHEVERLAPPRSRDIGTLRERHREEPSLATRTTAVRAAEHTLDDMRRVMFAPFPTPEPDFPASLELLLARFGQYTGSATHLTLLGRARAVQAAQRTTLLRLMQEALLNVQQHAHADGVDVTLRFDATSLALMIQDDGVGLLDGTYERPGLHALRAMQYRLAELGGRLDVFETETGGVTVRATLPLD